MSGPRVRNTRDGATLAVRVSPGGRHTRILGILGEALKIAVQAPPEKGKANDAVVGLLADALDARRADMLSALDNVDSGEGVVVLTDMFGGSPSNLAISAMERPSVEVIAGVNLPMLVKLASVRGDAGLDETIMKAQEAGRKYISVASQILAAN